MSSNSSDNPDAGERRSSKLVANKPDRVSSGERSRYSRVSDIEEGPKVPSATPNMVFRGLKRDNVGPSPSKMKVEAAGATAVSDVKLDIPKVERVIIVKKADHTTYGCIHMYEKYPCIVVLLVLVLSLSCGGWILYSGDYQYSSPSDRDFLVRNKNTAMLYDVMYLAQNAVYKMNADPQYKQTEVNDDWTTHLIVVSKVSKTVFSQENIKCIRRVADQVRSMTGVEKFCLKDKVANSECSPIEFMRGIVFSFGDDMEDDEVQTKLQALQSYPENRAYLERGITLTSTYSNVTRVIFRFAMPITVSGENYTDKGDRADDQADLFKDFSIQLKDYVGAVDDPELQFYVYSNALYERIYVDTIKDDSEYLVFTAVFIFCYLWFRCQSFFLSICGFFQVVLSFPIAYMFYKPLFGISYIGIVHVVAVYIGLVVSIENIIIFISNWRHSKKQSGSKVMRKRMNYTILKSFGPITASSFVAIVAFASTIFSEIIPISTFGIAMALILGVNYVLLFTYFPCVLFFYWKYLRKLFDCIDCVRKLVNPTHERYELARKLTLKNKGEGEGNSSADRPDLDAAYRRGSAGSSSQGDKEPRNPKLGLLETFFENCFAPIISKIAIVVLVAFVGWMIYMIYLCAKLPSVSKPEQFLPDDYDISYARKVVQGSFGYGDGDDNVVVHFVYGIKDVDLTDVSFYDTDNIGKLEWDSTFNLTPAASQLYFIQTCNSLKDVSPTALTAA